MPVQTVMTCVRGAAIALVVGVAAPSQATELYDHNGSTMRLERSGGDVRILYERPRAGLEGVGVRPGTLLFEGRLADGPVGLLDRRMGG